MQQIVIVGHDTRRKICRCMIVDLRRVSERRPNIFLALCLWNINWFLYNWQACSGASVTKLCVKWPLYLKRVIALHWEFWSDLSSHQCSIYVYILMNYWIVTNTTGSYCLKIYTTCWKCPPQARTKISNVDELKPRIKNECLNSLNHTVGDVALPSTCSLSCWRQTFRAYDAKMMCPITRLSIFETTSSSAMAERPREAWYFFD